MLLSDLSAAEITALVESTHTASNPRSTDRREEFSARYLAMRERPDELVKERIRQTFQNPKIAAQVCRFATGMWNPIRRLSGRVAKAYSNAPIRRLDGRPEDENSAYLRVLENLRFNARCREWNRWQVAMNTVAVLAKPCKSADGSPTLDFFKVTGAASEVILDPYQPFSDAPAILSYCIWPDPKDRNLARIDQEMVCAIDGHAFHYFDRGNRLVRVVEHGLGRFPGAILRSTDPEPGDSDDWWDPDIGRSVTQALRDAGMVGAQMAWARKSLFGKLIAIERNPVQSTVAAEPEQQAAQTLGNPEGPLDLPDGSIVVKDIAVSVKEFREHMGMVLAEAARDSTGNASLLDDPQSGGSTTDVAEVAKHAALRGLQREQIEYLMPFERSLAEVMAGLGRSIGMKGLPAPEVVRDSLDISFVPLTFLDTPEARLKFYQSADSFGVADQVDYMQEQGYTEQEARAELLAKAERRAELHEIQASRMTPNTSANAEVDPAAPGEPPAAQTGRFGGRASPALAQATE